MIDTPCGLRRSRPLFEEDQLTELNRNISRRSLLAMLGASAAGLLAARGNFALGRTTDDFDMLVLGDSVAWGQGLEERNKFYTLTENWLDKDIFHGTRNVRVKVKAHSGATIKLSREEEKALVGAGKDPKKPLYHPEINLSFPSITEQVRQAAAEYGDPASVRLILVSGGIPEVGVGNILNPFKSDTGLRRDIKTACFDHMSELLDLTARKFPSALIAVIGYYPIITSATPMKRIINDVLELYNWPRWTKPLMNNVLQRQLWRRYRRTMIRRSNIWFEDSTRQLGRAVEHLNNRSGTERAVFVPSTIRHEHGYGARNSYLWKVARKGRPADETQAERVLECAPALGPLREETELKYRTRVCELASIGHPNALGAEAIALSIRETLAPYLAAKVSNVQAKNYTLKLEL